MKNYKEFFALIILLVILGSLYHIISNIVVDYTFITFIILNIFGYVIGIPILNTIRKKWDNKYFNLLFLILNIPFAIFDKSLKYMAHFHLMIYHIMLYFIMVVFLPDLTLKLLDYYHLIDFLKESTKHYLIITSYVAISIFLNRLINKTIVKCTITHLNKPKNAIAHYKMALTLLSVDNIRFAIYLFYCFILFVMNISNYQETVITTILDNQRTIIQSFVTFITFDKTYTLFKELKFKPSKLLKING